MHSILFLLKKRLFIKTCNIISKTSKAGIPEKCDMGSSLLKWDGRNWVPKMVNED